MTTIRCQSGQATGERCECEGPAPRLIEWMPPQHRASHRAAGGAGEWPGNGALRLWCCDSCATDLLEDREWAREVTPTVLATIWIVSGEGTGQGHRQRYEGAMTVLALEARLTRERCGGDRWARVEVETATRHSEETTPVEALAAYQRSIVDSLDSDAAPFSASVPE